MNYSDVYREIQQGAAGGCVPGWLSVVLNDVAEGRRRMNAVRHPLGFVCLQVERLDDWGMCVHVWTAGMTRANLTTSSVHAHSWDLLSFVLYGQVRNELMYVTDAPAAPERRVFEVRSRGDVDEVRATSRLVSCGGTMAQLNRAGDTYAVPAGEFHMTVVPEDQDAATFVLGRDMPGTADLSLGAIQTRTHQVSRQRCDAAEAALAARIVARRLTVGRTAQPGGGWRTR